MASFRLHTAWFDYTSPHVARWSVVIGGFFSAVIGAF